MVGLIAFANDGGLGIQTKRLYDMLKPDKVMIIDSTGFSMNKQLHLDWYPEGSQVVKGFPKNYDILEFIKGLTTVFTVENPYNFYLIHACRERGIRTIVQTNYEFCENVFARHLPVPDLFLMPSHWKVDEMKAMFGHDRVIHLPPPIDSDEFAEPRDSTRYYNKKRFLHIVGTLAFEDRNGTLDLLESLKLSKGDYELVIHSQHVLPDRYIIDDPRVEYRIRNFKKNSNLYHGFNALILPRRYGGLSLTTNEALMSGMPVMMTDISPNNQLLPKEWLVESKLVKTFQARAKINCYSAVHQALADKLDEWAKDVPNRFDAFYIAYHNFSPKNLRILYNSIIQK